MAIQELLELLLLGRIAVEHLSKAGRRTYGLERGKDRKESERREVEVKRQKKTCQKGTERERQRESGKARERK